MRRSRRSVLGGLAALPVLGARPADAAHTSLWSRWRNQDPESTTVVDHALWGDLLTRYLRVGADGVNRVAYASVTAQDRYLLRDYLHRMSVVPVDQLRRAEQFAYWSNLYNALTVDLVLRHYPVESIRDIDISPGPSEVGPWGAKLMTVDGEPISLGDIEHRILRPIWHDPCVHYALNRATIGCPNLQRLPFTTRSLSQHLDSAVRAFVNDPRGVTLGPDGLFVSSMYVWNEADFGGSEQGILRHLMTFAEPGLAMRLQDVHGIAGDRYDWRLNEVR